MGRQAAIGAKIVDIHGHYVLALKANQPELHADVQALFADARATRRPEYEMTSATETTGGHGWVETRTVYVISNPEVIANLNPGNRWRNLASVVLVEAVHTADGSTTTNQRSYVLD